VVELHYRVDQLVDTDKTVLEFESMVQVHVDLNVDVPGHLQLDVCRGKTRFLRQGRLTGHGDEGQSGCDSQR